MVDQLGTRSDDEPSGPDLNLSAAQSRRLIELASAHVLGFREGLASGVHPASYVDDSLDPAAYEDGIRAAKELREDVVPTNGTSVEVLLGEIFGPAMANGTMHPHPGFMAHVPSGGLFQSAVADFVARSVNRFAGVWIAAPGFQQIERNVIRWFCSMLGYGEGSFGYLTTGGSIANFMAVVCAREHDERARPAGGEPVLYVSAEGHFSITKAARMAGFPASAVRVIPTTPAYAMDTDALIAHIEADRALGHRPTCVIATAGTTNSGAVDNLPLLAEYCRAHDIWLHVDACFGGFFHITERGRAALAGIENADSIAVDGHKSLFLPHGNSALLVRDQRRLGDAFRVSDAAYLPGLTTDDELVDFCGLGPELSREVRGVTAWLPLKMHGIHAFERALDTAMDLAADFSARAARLPGIEVIQPHPLVLPVVNFRLLPEHEGADEARLNARLCALICSRKNAYLATTQLPGYGVVVRVCILHPRTDAAVVGQLLDDITWALNRLRAESDTVGRSPRRAPRSGHRRC
ncbi:aminotransferase class V-fold PLP-dependent enzyme [Embleya sp. NBC_00896]|uniref:pyridoxal phosphate-dependent decarboxylase family protein n=1 Tax=Embleya sp. NBC_00896 TaxID=2975961 RepID=UPI002F90C95E|nr:aminotransferase class V-fold PLP-dependent enzyme [Embleya sp. NBC_00896]